MKNFEKFQNKQLPEAQAAKIMGGDSFFEYCRTAGLDQCIASFYHYNSLIWCGSTSQDSQCHDYWCQLAINECTMS